MFFAIFGFDTVYIWPLVAFFKMLNTLFITERLQVVSLSAKYESFIYGSLNYIILRSTDITYIRIRPSWKLIPT